ncbi:MAG TPA: hypothetical protein VHA13_05640, partial [Gammaproteobacteria bacterium]|nr:hypothetical protein [Gammaproteobacteria bacterium]
PEPEVNIFSKFIHLFYKPKMSDNNKPVRTIYLSDERREELLPLDVKEYPVPNEYVTQPRRSFGSTEINQTLSDSMIDNSFHEINLDDEQPESKQTESQNSSPSKSGSSTPPTPHSSNNQGLFGGSSPIQPIPGNRNGVHNTQDVPPSFDLSK